MTRKFDPAKWERLLSEERWALLDPSAFLDSIGVEPGSVAADLDAGQMANGSNYFLIAHPGRA